MAKRPRRRGGRPRAIGKTRYDNGKVKEPKAEETVKQIRATALQSRSKFIHPDSAGLPEAGFALGRAWLTAQLHDTTLISGGVMVPIVNKRGVEKARTRLEAGIRWAQYLDLYAKLKGLSSPLPKAIDYGQGVVAGGGGSAPEASAAAIERITKIVLGADRALAKEPGIVEALCRKVCVLDEDVAGWPIHSLWALRRGLDALAIEFKLAV